MNFEALLAEIQFKAVRSSGSGGQHVNKVSSKIVLQFNVLQSKTLTANQKERLLKAMQSRLTSGGVLVLECSDTRSQHQNKKLITERFLALIENSLKEKKPRKPTKIPKTIKIKRLKEKRLNAEKKANRKPPI